MFQTVQFCPKTNYLAHLELEIRPFEVCESKIKNNDRDEDAGEDGIDEKDEVITMDSDDSARENREPIETLWCVFEEEEDFVAPKPKSMTFLCISFL
ncbi:hypothetical protein B9Z55_027329 [Caenorhabditis nigoni]|uniref:Uncharacterized protein n=1 Tax=Caenorhabditis nigoni TaxID=1611254 RepID=A0A2G5SGE3_9PELO|nr:hypothetical protein B9Z55_027329 [Caenorhabditis nigoni]